MNNLSTLLEYLDEDIDEAAVSVKQAISEKLAAYTNQGAIILYNPEMAANNINDNIQQDYAIEDIITFEGAIVGYVNTEPNDYCGTNTYEVKNSAALSGYGPLLYDMTLSHIYPNYLTADRSSVSSKAQKVWDYYFYNRKDVNKLLITSIYDPELDDTCRLPNEIWNKYRSTGKLISNVETIYHDLQLAIDEGEDQKFIDQLQSEYDKAKEKAHKYFSQIPIAHKYQIKSPKGLTALKNNHSRFLQRIPSLIPKQKLYRGFNIKAAAEENLWNAAEHFFGEMYDD